MKTLKGKPSLHLILILLLIATSCVPDSLTKFKEDGASSDDASSAVGEVVDPPSEFVDEAGNEIDGDSISVPSSIFYDNSVTHIFITGDTSLANTTNGKEIVNFIQPLGNFGDYTIEEDEGVYSITTATKNNFLSSITNPGFNFGSDILTTYAATFSTDNETGIISLSNNSVSPVREFTLASANFNYYHPGDENAETLTITTMPRVTVQAPIPEQISFEVDQSFNCTGANIGTIPPASPEIGDVYQNAGTCYYNYDGTNTNTVAFPFTGPVYIGFQLDDNSGFLLDGVTNEPFTTENGATGTISYKDSSNNIFGTLSSGSIYPGDLIDNSFPFSNREGTIQKVKYFFQPDSNINLKLINNTAVSSAENISYRNSTSISITPDLPSTLRLVKDVDSPLFGYIIDTSGALEHTIQQAKEYTVTVKNSISTRTFSFDIGIVNPPENLSYSQMVAFKVKNLVQNFSTFYVGQKVSTAVNPPLSEGAQGVVKRILDIDGNEKYLIVQVLSGTFLKDSSIDNYKQFLDEEAVILNEPISLTHVLELNSTAAFTPTYLETMPALCMEFPAAPTNEFARAIVTGNPTEAGLANYIFVNQIKNPNDIGSKRNFIASNTAISDCSLGTNYIVQEMWTPVIKTTFSSVASLVSGMDILTASNAASLSLSGIDTIANTALLQSADGKPITLALPENFSSVRPYSVNAATITDYEALATFELQRGVDSNIIATLPKGESVTYSISPDLPPGLTLDTDTGIISGRPEVAAASKTYTISATNILGVSSTSFDILVEDYFEVELDIDRTPVFYAHKDGQGNPFNKCRIKKRDIVSNPRTLASDIEDVVDIDCFFDIGEGDIYKREMELKANVGPGICHTMQYVPFSYFKRRPNKTTEDQIVYDGTRSDYIVQVVSNASTECLGAATINFSAGDGNGNPFGGGDADLQTYSRNGTYVNGRYYEYALETLCTGKYSNEINCDNGSISYAEIDFVYTPAVLDDTGAVVTPDSCTNTVTPKTFLCEGNPRQCLDGPVVEEFTREKVISNGTYALSVQAFDGINESYTPGHPIKKSGDINVTVSNYFAETSCHDGNTEYYADGVKLHAESADMFNSPNSIVDPIMGAHPFYTFNCLDQADDLLARINVHIRDWDTSFNVTNLDKAFVAGNWGMDNSLTDVFGEPVNSTTDWDDLNRGSNYSACGPATAPTVGNVFTALPLTVAIDAERTDRSLIVTGGFPSEYVYPGMEIQVQGEIYQVKAYDNNEIILTLPIKDFLVPAGTAIFGRYLYEFPAYKYNDSDDES